MKWTIKYKNKSGEKMLKIIKMNKKKITKKRSGKNEKKKLQKKNEREKF